MKYPELADLDFTPEQVKGIAFMRADANARQGQDLPDLSDGQFLSKQLTDAADSFARDYRTALKADLHKAREEAGEVLTLADLEQQLADVKGRKKTDDSAKV